MKKNAHYIVNSAALKLSYRNVYKQFLIKRL